VPLYHTGKAKITKNTNYSYDYTGKKSKIALKNNNGGGLSWVGSGKIARGKKGRTDGRYAARSLP